MQPLGEKKITQPLMTKKITQALRTKKITQPLGTNKKSRNLLGHKNVLRIQILVTIKIQEIGTDHLGLVLDKKWFKIAPFQCNQTARFGFEDDIFTPSSIQL